MIVYNHNKHHQTRKRKHQTRRSRTCMFELPRPIRRRRLARRWPRVYRDRVLPNSCRQSVGRRMRRGYRRRWLWFRLPRGFFEDSSWGSWRMSRTYSEHVHVDACKSTWERVVVDSICWNCVSNFSTSEISSSTLTCKSHNNDGESELHTAKDNRPDRKWQEMTSVRHDCL